MKERNIRRRKVNAHETNEGSKDEDMNAEVGDENTMRAVGK